MTNVNNVDFTRCDRLAEELPLSREFRPTWDVNILSRLGFRDIDIRYLDAGDNRTGDTGIHAPVNFAVCARLPYSNVSIADGPGPDQLEPVMGLVDGMSDDIKDTWSVLSNKDCVKLLLSMCSVDLTVGQAAELLGCSYPLASHDMKKLKDAGFVDFYKENNEKIYFLTRRDIINDLCIMTNILSGKHLKSKGV
ncbi:MAG: helix-turn-helix transcriptional regulator [Thermoplasmata archaeon]|nr:helix-turn-helix transcriptional regulator [Thermoplasmata archaeon]